MKAGSIIITDNNLNYDFCNKINEKYGHSIALKNDIGLDSEVIVQLIITISGVVASGITEIIKLWLSEKIKERKTKKSQKIYKQEIALIYPNGKTVILVRTQDLDEISSDNIEDLIFEIKNIIEDF